LALEKPQVLRQNQILAAAEEAPRAQVLRPALQT
jgi:hypothetical protein